MIEVEHLTKIYQTKARSDSGLGGALRAAVSRKRVPIAALTRIDWQVASGEVHALVGPNGSGKSTLIKLLCGIVQPTTGKVTVGGLVPWSDRRRYVRDIGVVFGQKSQLTWELPAVDSFELQRVLFSIPRSAFEDTLDALVAAFHVASVVTRPVRSLSLGERMKCELLCALLHRPKVLFLDEPTIGLDQVSKQQVRDAVMEANRVLGTTVILTSHDVSDVVALCPNISLLKGGRLVYQGSIEGLLQQFSPLAKPREADRRVGHLERAIAEVYGYGSGLQLGSPCL